MILFVCLIIGAMSTSLKMDGWTMHARVARLFFGGAMNTL